MKRILAVIILILISSSVNAGEAKLKPYKGDLHKPTIVLKDLKGVMHDLGDYKNQVVLVQFWATYCTPCRKEMPSMNRLQGKLKGKPFKILAVDMAEETSEVIEFVKQVKPEFTILLDTDGAYIQKWRVFAAPANFIIGKDGEIKYTLYGGVEWDSKEIIKAITELL